MPSVQDERNTYTLWGWTWNEATANPVYSSAPGYVISNPDIHGDTEGDDLWAYLHAYRRRGSAASFAGYKTRADRWRDFWVSNPSLAGDGSPPDHMCLWGLVEYSLVYGDPAALTAALSLATTKLYNVYSTLSGGTWPIPGSFRMAYWGHRGNARNLRNAVVVADATGDANIIMLRDKLIDLWLQSPDWDNTNGMYWVSADQMASYNVAPPLSYAAGDRAVSSFHIGVLAEAFYAAWLSPNVTQARKAALRAKIVAMAAWMRANGLDPTHRYCSTTLGIRGSGGAWWNYSLNSSSPTFWDGVYTTSIVNLLVMGYKFTGDTTFLSGPASNGHYPAQYCFNRGTKSIYGSLTQREVADNVAGHFVDTKFDSSSGNVYLGYNRGELQYTYLIFENGGTPTVF
jgi:hypothetical protein